MRRAARAGVVAAALAAAACADVLLPADPASGPVEVVRAAWKEVDAYYPWFALKGVDWDAIGEEFLPRVTPATTEAELFALLSRMLDTLRDGHLALESGSRRHAWEGWYADYPTNFSPEAVGKYLVGSIGATKGGVVSWALLRERMGYIRIPSFTPDDVGAGVDAALEALAPLDGVVVDVRSNGGGSDTQSEAAAGRFVDHAAPYRRVRYKTGPGHEDFGPEIESTVAPQGAHRFTGPVVVLQNRGVFSAAEDFILAMHTRADVTFVGDTTGGGSGNPIGRELPNGWILRVPRWRQATPAGEVYEGIGLAPDVFTSVGAEDQDRILERGIQLLIDVP